MVILARRYQKKGRPKILKTVIDQGTPELQQKRQLFLKSLNLKDEHINCQQVKPLNASIFDGCYLYQLFYRNLVTQQHLETGLNIRKIYGLCLRSQGIKNRLACSLRQSKNLEGNVPNQFEDKIIEEKWHFLKSFIEHYADNVLYAQLILKIILNDFFKKDTYSILTLKNDFIKTLRQSLDKLTSIIHHPSFSKDINNRY